jgi:hypothetical protein
MRVRQTLGKLDLRQSLLGTPKQLLVPFHSCSVSHGARSAIAGRAYGLTPQFWVRQSTFELDVLETLYSLLSHTCP